MINQNFLRQYYDVYELLGDQTVVGFIGTSEYKAHKIKRFNSKEIKTPLAENAAFDFSVKALLETFK